MANVGSSIASAAGSLLGTAVSTAGSAVSTSEQLKAQKELAQFQYDKAVEMWNKNNEYNTPTNVMKRLREAGVNPQTAFSNGVSYSPAATSDLPKYQAPDITKAYQSINAGIRGIGQAVTNAAQVQNLSYQNTKLANEVRAIDSLIDKQNQEREESASRTRATDIESFSKLQKLPVELRTLAANSIIAENQADAAKSYWDEKIKNLQASTDNLLAGAYASFTTGARNLSDVERNNFLNRVSLADIRLKETLSNLNSTQQYAIGVGLAEVWARVDNLEKQGKNYDSQSIVNIINAIMKSSGLDQPNLKTKFINAIAILLAKKGGSIMEDAINFIKQK